MNGFAGRVEKQIGNVGGGSAEGNWSLKVRGCRAAARHLVNFRNRFKFFIPQT